MHSPSSCKQGSVAVEPFAGGLSGISVCIPVFNEAERIAPVVAEAQAALAQLPGEHEVLVVNDGSTDSTAQVLESLSRRWPNIRVFHHSQNRGLAQAQKTLLAHARGQYIFHVGGDGQWRMADMIPMFWKLQQGYDVVLGVRRHKHYGPWRRLVSWSYNALVAVLWGRWYGDLGSVKMARARVWKSLPVQSTSAFANAERVLLAQGAGARIATLPVAHRPRPGGRSSFVHPKQALRALADLIRFRLRGFPQKQDNESTWTAVETSEKPPASLSADSLPPGQTEVVLPGHLH